MQAKGKTSKRKATLKGKILLEENNIQVIISVAKKIFDSITEGDTVICLGRSTVSVEYALQSLSKYEGKELVLKHVDFSGTILHFLDEDKRKSKSSKTSVYYSVTTSFSHYYDEKVTKENLILENLFDPTMAIIEDFAKNLKESKDLSAESIIENFKKNNKKTIIIDSTRTGKGIMSFFYCLYHQAKAICQEQLLLKSIELRPILGEEYRFLHKTALHNEEKGSINIHISYKREIYLHFLKEALTISNVNINENIITKLTYINSPYHLCESKDKHLIFASYNGEFIESSTSHYPPSKWIEIPEIIIEGRLSNQIRSVIDQKVKKEVVNYPETTLSRVSLFPKQIGEKRKRVVELND